MRGDFRIHYQTAIGQRLQVVVDGGEHDLEWLGGGWWGGSVDLAGTERYTYRVVGSAGELLEEPGPARHVDASWPSGVTVVDRWRSPDPTRRARHSTFFSRARCAHFPEDRGEVGGNAVQFELFEPWIPVGMAPAVWFDNRAVPMTPGPYPRWVAAAPIDTGYRYVLLDEDGSVAAHEEGHARMLPEPGRRPTIVRDEGFRGMSPWRGAGVAIPVFALRTPAGVGVGQFTDLVPFADWAIAAGLSVIQLLPVNDTVRNHDWDDSYPYNPISTRALHPLYIDLAAIAGGGIDTEIAVARAEFNGLPEVDFPCVMQRKTALLRVAYANLSDGLDADPEFAAFVDDHWDWLGPYSLWCARRDRFGTPEAVQWGDAVTFDPGQLQAASLPDSDEYDDLRYYWFVQFHLHRQLNWAASEVRARGIGLKGDLPIGVAPASVDVWSRPELFHHDVGAGAPPDAFARRGQNWGFPTYDWEAMAADGYGWWRSRLHGIAAYVDLYRIDHVLGFFRVWEIPIGAHDGSMGHFRPSLPLSEEEIVAALGLVDVAALTRPLLEEGGADGVAAGATQEDIRAAFAAGAFGDLGVAAREALERRALDVAADVLLVELDGGFAPVVRWQDATHYKRFSPDQQRAFDAMAGDFFHERHRTQWEEQGRRTLPHLLATTDLLACGEDLGFVPDFVPHVMNEMGLLSLEIERMPKRLGEWIADPGAAPYLSVVSPGTHDTTTLRQWWEEDRERATRYWHEVLGRPGDPPAEASPELVAAILERQLASPAMLCIIPIADLFATDPHLRHPDPGAERINDPANPHNRWHYRMGRTIDELSAAKDFTERLREVIRASGR